MAKGLIEGLLDIVGAYSWVGGRFRTNPLFLGEGYCLGLRKLLLLVFIRTGVMLDCQVSNFRPLTAVVDDVSCGVGQVGIVLIWTGEVLLVFVLGDFNQQAYRLALPCQLYVSTDLVELTWRSPY